MGDKIRTNKTGKVLAACDPFVSPYGVMQMDFEAFIIGLRQIHKEVKIRR